LEAKSTSNRNSSFSCKLYSCTSSDTCLSVSSLRMVLLLRGGIVASSERTYADTIRSGETLEWRSVNAYRSPRGTRFNSQAYSEEGDRGRGFTIALVLFELRSMTLYSNQLMQDEWSKIDSQFTYKSQKLPQHRTPQQQTSPTMQVVNYSARILTSLKGMVSQCPMPRFLLPLPPISLPISRALLDTCLDRQDYWYE